jgi:hypothetical protein
MMKRRRLMCLLFKAEARALQVLVAAAAGLLKFRKKRRKERKKRKEKKWSLMWKKLLHPPICTWGLQSSGSHRI